MSRLLVRKRKRNNCKKILDLWKTQGCQFCGSQDNITGHHVYGVVKEAELTKIVHSGQTKKLEREMAKCIPLCRSCHTDLHRQWDAPPPSLYSLLMDQIRSLLVNLPVIIL